jgi:hypothetical protein
MFEFQSVRRSFPRNLAENSEKTRGFPNRGERYGAKYENGVAYLLSYIYCISRKTVDTEYTYYSWCMTSTDIVKWRKNERLWKFEKGMIYMKILKKGVSVGLRYIIDGIFNIYFLEAFFIVYFVCVGNLQSLSSTGNFVCV